jgi:hypothetical protein
MHQRESQPDRRDCPLSPLLTLWANVENSTRHKGSACHAGGSCRYGIRSSTRSTLQVPLVPSLLYGTVHISLRRSRTAAQGSPCRCQLLACCTLAIAAAAARQVRCLVNQLCGTNTTGAQHVAHAMHNSASYSSPKISKCYSLISVSAEHTTHPPTTRLSHLIRCAQ